MTPQAREALRGWSLENEETIKECLGEQRSHINRDYVFGAMGSSPAEEWVERLETCLEAGLQSLEPSAETA